MAERNERIGQRFGDYVLQRRLGRGSFGDVYLGEHVYEHSLAAVKVLHIRLTRSEDLRAFINEARTFRLQHPHIVRVLDIGIAQDETPFLVTAYAPGGTLRDQHPKGSRLSQAQVLGYVLPIASALQYAHDLHLIHRDIKPENMLLGAGGALWLSDFGIASVAHASNSLSVYEGVGGTLPYMAPEQIEGKPRRESDQYALAVVVYEWLVGTRPFQGTASELISQHLHTPPPSLLDQMPTLPAVVEQVVFKALAKQPQERFAQVDDFALALKQASQVTQPESVPDIVVPVSETTEANQYRQPTAMATPVSGISLSQQPVSTVSADLPARPQKSIPSSDKERLPQAEEARRQEKEQADNIEEERVRKAEEEHVHPIKGKVSPQLRQTALPTTSPHEAIPPLRPTFLPSDNLLHTDIPAQSPATLLPPTTLGWTKRHPSPAVVFVLILILLGGASFAVYGTATGNWPWNVWHAQTSGTSEPLFGVAWSGSQFVAVGGTILTSPDGHTWSAQHSGTSQALYSVAWSGSQFVAVGYPTILTSSDGHTWSALYTGQQLNGVAWSGSQFVAVGLNGTILTSSDGRTWSAQHSGTSQVLDGVAWSGSQFVVVGVGGTILTSPDGHTWSAQHSLTSQALDGVAWSGSQSVVVGYDGGILTSP